MSKSTNNLSVVKRIGAGVRLTEEAVESIVATLPDGFNPDERGAVAEIVHVWACGDGPREAVKRGKVGAQVTTDYGRGHDTLVKAVKRALKAQQPPAGPVLRVNLSGAESGNGSAVVPADHPLYAALVALIAGESAEDTPALTVAA